MEDHEDAALRPRSPPGCPWGRGGHHSSPNYHLTPRKRPNPRAATPRAGVGLGIPKPPHNPPDLWGRDPPLQTPCPSCGCPRRGERGPVHPHRDTPRCRAAEPGERDPPATSPPEPRAARGHLPKEVPAGNPSVPGLAHRGGVPRLAPGGRGGDPPAERAPQGCRSGGGEAAPGAARLSGDSAMRRYGATGASLARS